MPQMMFLLTRLPKCWQPLKGLQLSTLHSAYNSLLDSLPAVPSTRHEGFHVNLPLFFLQGNYFFLLLWDWQRTLFRFLHDWQAFSHEKKSQNYEQDQKHSQLLILHKKNSYVGDHLKINTLLLIQPAFPFRIITIPIASILPFRKI